MGIDNEEIISFVKNELALSYEASGRKSPEAISVIAASLQEAIGFSCCNDVHEVFRRARNIEAIPTQKTLNECYRNYSEEVLKYRAVNAETKMLENKSSRSAWLPDSDMKKRINIHEAIKNYCNAVGGDLYFQYCRAHIRTEKKAGDNRIIEWQNPDAAFAFDGPIKEYLVYLYRKYWRLLPIANGYPKEAPLNLGLIPPSVPNFKVMLAREERNQNGQ